MCSVKLTSADDVTQIFMLWTVITRIWQNKYLCSKQSFQFSENCQSYKEADEIRKDFPFFFFVFFIPFLLTFFYFCYFLLLVRLSLSLHEHGMFILVKLLFWKQFWYNGYVNYMFENSKIVQKQSWYHCFRFAYSNQVLCMTPLRMLLHGDIKRLGSLSANTSHSLFHRIVHYRVMHRKTEKNVFSKRKTGDSGKSQCAEFKSYLKNFVYSQFLREKLKNFTIQAVR
jgi:hypothetical protein